MAKQTRNSYRRGETGGDRAGPRILGRKQIINAPTPLLQKPSYLIAGLSLDDSCDFLAGQPRYEEITWQPAFLRDGYTPFSFFFSFTFISLEGRGNLEERLSNHCLGVSKYL